MREGRQGRQRRQVDCCRLRRAGGAPCGRGSGSREISSLGEARPHAGEAAENAEAAEAAKWFSWQSRRVLLAVSLGRSHYGRTLSAAARFSTPGGVWIDEVEMPKNSRAHPDVRHGSNLAKCAANFINKVGKNAVGFRRSAIGEKDLSPRRKGAKETPRNDGERLSRGRPGILAERRTYPTAMVEGCGFARRLHLRRSGRSRRESGAGRNRRTPGSASCRRGTRRCLAPAAGRCISR
jgi:hypothetical protein